MPVAPARDPLYRGYRFPAEIISYAVWLYYRFALSHRDVEELLAVRGVQVSYEAVRLSCRKFGPTIGAALRRRRAGARDRWHLVEVERLPRQSQAPKPLWLWWQGPAGTPLDLALIWRVNVHRFDFEHTFRDYERSMAAASAAWTILKMVRHVFDVIGIPPHQASAAWTILRMVRLPRVESGRD